MVRVRLSALMRLEADDQETVEVSGRTPVECASELVARFPRLRRLLYDKEGELRPQVWFFVNGDKLLVDELDRELSDGDELFLVVALSGG